MAAVARAGGYSDFSSGGSTNYIQKLYARQLLRKYYKIDVISKITNSLAENQSSIKQIGDKVIFRKRPTIAINRYYKGKTLTYESPTQASIEMDIDTAYDWAFQIDNIDLFQSDIKIMSEYSDEGAKELKQTISTNFLAAVYDDGSSSNYGTSAGIISGNLNLGTSSTPKVITRDNVLYVFNDMGQTLDEQDIPSDNRHITIPPAFWNMIQSSDLKNASFAGDGQSKLLNGAAVHNISGFDIHVTNCVNTQGDGSYQTFDVVFNHMDAITFCMQITETDILPKLESTFGSAARGLAVYGFKVVQPKAIGWLYCAIQN